MLHRPSKTGSLFVLLFFWLIESHCAQAARFGPREDPERYPDYGGTADLVLSGDVGLSEDELSQLLEQLNTAELQTRVAAATQIKKNAAGCEAVYRNALWRVGFVRHAELKAVLKRAEAGGGDDVGTLVTALVQMEPADPAVALATKIVVMLVALQSLDTMAGYKVLLDFSGRHAGAFRSLIGEMLVHAGLKALPALIYGRGSKNDELHMFAVAWIRDMGNPLLSEQIQGIKNSRRLAQLLEAYASVNELDAIDVTLSCANHDSAFVRNAARACLAAYGKNAKWSIHREYENNFEDAPADGTDYEEWAAALYELWDSQREKKTQTQFQKGLKAAKAEQFDEMDKLYRELLASTPLFAERAQMADGYLKYAAALEADGQHEKAVRFNRMAKRLAEEDSPTYAMAQTRLEWLYVEANRKGGGLDSAAYQQLAKQDGMDNDASRWAKYGKYIENNEGIPWWKVAIVSLLIFLGTILIFIRTRIST